MSIVHPRWWESKVTSKTKKLQGKTPENAWPFTYTGSRLCLVASNTNNTNILLLLLVSKMCDRYEGWYQGRETWPLSTESSFNKTLSIIFCFCLDFLVVLSTSWIQTIEHPFRTMYKLNTPQCRREQMVLIAYVCSLKLYLLYSWIPFSLWFIIPVQCLYIQLHC